MEIGIILFIAMLLLSLLPHKARISHDHAENAAPLDAEYEQIFEKITADNVPADSAPVAGRIERGAMHGAQLLEKSEVDP